MSEIRENNLDYIKLCFNFFIKIVYIIKFKKCNKLNILANNKNHFSFNKYIFEKI